MHQVTVFRMLRALVSRRVGNNGHRQQEPSPSELNSEVHKVLLPLLLDAVQALPPCSAPQVRGTKHNLSLYLS